MPKINSIYVPLLILFLSAFSFTNKIVAADTLTSRQVYAQLNVGDTFDFATYENNQFFNFIHSGYYRIVLMHKVYSPAGDTLYLSYGDPTGSVVRQDTITDLDSFLVFHVPKPDSACSTFYSFSTAYYPQYVSNQVSFSCNGSDLKKHYTSGLGLTRYDHTSYDAFAGLSDEYTEWLIYYSNGTKVYGTPYYILAGNQMVSRDFKVSLSPNPFTENVTLTIPDTYPTELSIIVCNMLGQVVYSDHKDKATEFSIALKNLPKGMYTFHVKSSNMNWVKQVLKE